MNIENEKDLQAWLELYKVMIADNPEVIFNDCANTADEAFKQYKKRAKAVEELYAERCKGIEALMSKKSQRFSRATTKPEDNDGWLVWDGGYSGAASPSSEVFVKVVYRNGLRDYGFSGTFSWTHLDAGTDIVKFKYV